MSLAPLRKVEEDGVTFRSHLDGAMVELTPERAMEVQILLGSDIAMQLDECVKLPAERAEIERAMKLSLRWAERSKRAFERAAAGRALFGIVQGGDDLHLREASARALVDIGFPGYAIGGLAVGETQSVMLEVVAATAAALPADRPRYLMGVGTPADLLEAIARGVDMFDCVLPTRNGRHGLAFTRFGPINIKNAHHADDPRPLDEESRCGAAREFSRAYLHHLFRSGEALGGHAPFAGQSVLLPGPDGGRPRCHRRRPLCRVCGGDQGAMGGKARHSRKSRLTKKNPPVAKYAGPAGHFTFAPALKRNQRTRTQPYKLTHQRSTIVPVPHARSPNGGALPPMRGDFDSTTEKRPKPDSKLGLTRP